jgi:hypothetical protein
VDLQLAAADLAGLAAAFERAAASVRDAVGSLQPYVLATGQATGDQQLDDIIFHKWQCWAQGVLDLGQACSDMAVAVRAGGTAYTSVDSDVQHALTAIQAGDNAH